MLSNRFVDVFVNFLNKLLVLVSKIEVERIVVVSLSVIISKN